jgi:hypothetical protein
MFFVGVIDISLSSTHENFLPFASAITIAILLDHHFLMFVPKFDTTLTFHFLRKASDVLMLLLENEVVAFTVLTVGLVTGTVTFGGTVLVLATIVLVGIFITSAVGASGTNFLLVFLIIILLVESVVAVGIIPFHSINAIGSTVLANNVSLQSHFSTTS